MRFASAISDARDTKVALEHVLGQLSGTLGGPADLVFVFATGDHRDNAGLIQSQVAEALSPRVMLGATAEGVIGLNRELQQASGLSILAARLPGARLYPLNYEQLHGSGALNRPESFRQAVGGDDASIKAIVILADPYTTPISGLLGLAAHCWPGVPVVGGMASAAAQPGQNRLLINGQVLREGAVGVLIGGDVRVDCTLSQGCRPIGKPLVITKSKRHVVYELGGRNALAGIQEMIENLDEEDRQLIQTRGLMVGRVINEYKDRFGRGDFLIRSLLAVDHDSGYVAINDPQIRVGQTIQFHVHDRRTAMEDFQLLLEAQKLHGPAGGALLFSCNGRGKRLYEQPDTDARIVNEALGDVPLAGFFAAGEIGPVGDQNFMHGHTASLVVFRSADVLAASKLTSAAPPA